MLDSTKIHFFRERYRSFFDSRPVTPAEFMGIIVLAPRGSRQNRVVKLGLVTAEIEKYDEPYPVGQWNWKDDAEMALSYYDKITKEGWAEYGGVVFNEAR